MPIYLHVLNVYYDLAIGKLKGKVRYFKCVGFLLCVSFKCVGFILSVLFLFSMVVVLPLSSEIFDCIKTVRIRHIVVPGKDWRQAMDINESCSNSLRVG